MRRQHRSMINKKDSPWVTTTEATEYLRVCRHTLSRNLKHMSYGHHYFRKQPGRKTSPILWHMERLEKFFCTPVAYKKKTV